MKLQWQQTVTQRQTESQYAASAESAPPAQLDRLSCSAACSLSGLMAQCYVCGLQSDQVGPRLLELLLLWF